MWTLLILCIIILSIWVVIASDEVGEGAISAILGIIICGCVLLIWVAFTNGVYLSPDYRVGHEITYGGKWGTIESIYYKVGDTLLLQKDIDFK